MNKFEVLNIRKVSRKIRRIVNIALLQLRINNY